MALKINKGGKLGKYFYLKDKVEYGPVELIELLEVVDKDTLVYFEGISWTEAKNIDELKKYFITEEKVVERVVEKEIFTNDSKFNSYGESKNLVVIIFTLIISCLVYLVIVYSNKVKRDGIEAQKKAERDSLKTLNDKFLAEELKRKQDSLLNASSAILDSAKLIKLDIDYKLGADKAKSLITQLFSQFSSHNASIEPFFSDTVETFNSSLHIANHDLAQELSAIYDNNNNLIESYQLIDSTLKYDGLDNQLGVFSFDFYYKVQDNSIEQSEKNELISASIKIKPDFKIIYYQITNRQNADLLGVTN